MLYAVQPNMCGVHVNYAELLALCHSGEVASSAAHLEAVMAAIYRGLQHLEAQVQRLERTQPDLRKVTGQHPQVCAEAVEILGKYGMVRK